METPTLDWNSAEVRNGTLTVELTGERPKGWKGTFERIVKLLGSGDWKAVKLKSGKVRISGVPEGAEESLRHFLEGVVQQANATHQPAGDGDEQRGSHASAGETRQRDDTDARMTERFRDFAQ
jgi:hypothetical protein